MPDLRYKRKAFTLAEVMIAVVLTAVVLAAAVSLFIAYQRTFLIGGAYLDIHSEARAAMDWIVKDARWATGIVKTKAPYATSNTSVILKIPSINASGLIIKDRYDYIIYRLRFDNALNADNIERIVIVDALSRRPAEARFITRSSSALGFTSNGTGLSGIPDVTLLTNVSVSVTVEKTVASLSGIKQKTVQDVLNATVKLRNRR